MAKRSNKKKRGRPPLKESEKSFRPKMLRVRLSEDEWSGILRTCKEAGGVSMSELVRILCVWGYKL